MSLAVIDQHRRVLTRLRELALVDMSSLTVAIRSMSVADAREALRAALPDLMDPFMGAASDASGVVLDELYAQAGSRMPKLHSAELLQASRVESLARWAVTPMADEALESTVLSRLSGAATRMIFDSSRLTMVGTVSRTPGGRRVYYQRVPRADCCAFCGMLASRPVWMGYKDKASAGEVVGRGSTRTGLDESGKRLSGGAGEGVKARGNQSLGTEFHDDCRCVVAPVLGGPIAEALEQSRSEWEEMYAEALPESRSAGMTLAEMTAAIRRGENVIDATNTKEVLANWRKVHGTK